MRKIKGRGILVTLLLIFGAYAYYDYAREKKNEMKQLDESRLLTVNYDQVDQVEIEREGQKIVLKRTVDGWELVEPLKDLADNQAVEGFINQFMTDKIIEVARTHGPIPETYGLDKPAGIVTLKTTAGPMDRFVVSAKKNFEENPFAERNGDERVLVVSPTVLKKAQMGVADFRDRRFLRRKIASLDTLKLKNEKGLLEISQKDGKWILNKEPQAAVDQNKVREFLQSIADAKGVEFVEPKSLPPGKLLFSLELVLQDKTWKADVTQSEDFAIYAKVSEPAQIMKMEPGALDRLIRASAVDFKEVTLPESQEKKDK
ncbi:hypothetical protein D3C87_240820 [compost metagenome]